MVIEFHFAKNMQRFRKFFALFVRSIFCSQSFKNISNHHTPCLYRHLIALRRNRISSTIYFFMVTNCIYRNVFKVTRPLYSIQHINESFTMAVNQLTFFLINFASTDSKVVNFIQCKEMILFTLRITPSI